MSPASLVNETDTPRGRMSTEPLPSPKASANAPSVPLAVRQRLQSVFEHAKKSLEKKDYVYAHDLFAQCVTEDPGTLVYLQHFRANLAQMHPDGGKRSGGLGSFLGKGRTGVAKAADKGAWTDAFTAGCQLLKKTPANTHVLCDLAAACGELGHTESQLYYLRWAMDLAPTDREINRLAAIALESIAQFDQAIVCWERVLKEKANDEEATRAISRLSVEKTIDQGGYNLGLLSTEVAEGAPPLVRVADLAKRDVKESTGVKTDAKEVTPASSSVTDESPTETEERLRAAIDADPDQITAYTQLADFYAGANRLQDAERLYRKGLEVAGGKDIALLEKLEEVYLRRMRERALIAARRAEKQPEAATAKIARQALAEANQAEVEVHTARADRSPDDPQLKYELGLRLKRIGKHREAIEPFQAAREDKSRLAQVQLHLGECFQQISQHSLAIRSYEASLEACDKAEWTDLRKLACYRTAVLALGLGELDLAEKHFTDLAGADFSYRDVGERLDKITQIRNAK